jgi:enoyl-CoA hydratase
VVPHEQLLPAARKVAASIVGNNQKAVRALLDSYHRIDAAQIQAGLWIEAESARGWMASTSGDDIAANRASVFERGRAQVRP